MYDQLTLYELQQQAITDRKKGLLTQQQLTNIIYRLDRISNAMLGNTQNIRR